MTWTKLYFAEYLDNENLFNIMLGYNAISTMIFLSRSLYLMFQETQVIDTEKVEHVDVKIEALMPRVSFNHRSR